MYISLSSKFFNSISFNDNCFLKLLILSVMDEIVSTPPNKLIFLIIFNL